jgi:hypothetical protein
MPSNEFDAMDSNAGKPHDERVATGDSREEETSVTSSENEVVGSSDVEPASPRADSNETTDMAPSADAGTGSAKSNLAKDISLIKVSFPEQLTPFVWLAIVAGALLIAISIFGHVRSWQLGAEGSLLVAAGVAIILAAFGGQATVRGKVYVLAGVTALAVVLVTFLEYRRDLDGKRIVEEMGVKAKQYVRGNIHEVPARQFQISLKFASNVLASTDLGLGTFRFAVFQDQAQEARIASLRLEPKDDDRVTSIPISTSCIVNSMGKDEPLDWELRRQDEDASYEVYDRRREQVIGRWPGRDMISCMTDVAFETHSIELASSLLGSSDAFAQGAPTAIPTPSRNDLEGMSDDLKSDDSAIRRSARDSLSTAPPEQVPAIIDIVRNDPDTYRTKLGVAVALTEMLRRSKAQRDIIVPLLDDADRELLLDLAGDSDRTLRIYASEFLFDLSDPGITRLAIPRAAMSTDDNARYNWLLVAQDGWRRLDATSRTALRPDLDSAYERSGEKTRKLFDKFE